MTLSLTLGLALVGACADNPRIPPFLPMNPSLDDIEVFRRQGLKQLRGDLAWLEEEIKFLEKMAVWIPEDADQYHRQAEELRAFIPVFKGLERQFLERQPGGYTAPPPRELNHPSSMR